MLLHWNNCGKFQISLAVIYQAVAVSFRTVMNVTRLESQHLPVIEHMTAALGDEHYFRTVVVSVETDGCSGDKSALHDAVEPVKEHSGGKFLFPAFERRQYLLLNCVEIKYHTQ